MKFAVWLSFDLLKQCLTFGGNRKKDWDFGARFMRVCLFALIYRMKPDLLKRKTAKPIYVKFAVWLLFDVWKK